MHAHILFPVSSRPVFIFLKYTFWKSEFAYSWKLLQCHWDGNDLMSKYLRKEQNQKALI